MRVINHGQETHKLPQQVYVFERHRQGEKTSACSLLIKLKKMVTMLANPPPPPLDRVVVEDVCSDKEGTDFSFPYFSIYDHCFIDREDLLEEIQGKWRGYSQGSQIRFLIDQPPVINNSYQRSSVILNEENTDPVQMNNPN